MNLTACPVCNSTNFEQVLEAKDYLVSRETFKINECHNCTLRFTNPRPDDAVLGSYYNSVEYISHTNEGNSLVNKLYKLARFFTLRGKEKRIRKNTAAKELLDIGCGTGHFLAHCKSKGWQVTGIEPDPTARSIAREELKLDVLEKLKEIYGKSYDRITLWHVLEHLPNLKEDLSTIFELLKDDGKLFIAVPNYLAYEAKVFQEHWAAYDVPRHLYHFTPEAMNRLVTKYGLKIDQVYPMRLDSFYISLLSNKQQYNRNNLVKSFITGLLSNIYAINSGNYSSLIYQISKQSEK